ncbi:hypothetical protein ACN28C_30760 [Plantactinospora sp. WMMC1484]|uniref:hypothetical protein n=1 Tax=Plantactinospora sp. WMMC1484 TaxID=3404122 RepID=UPI003BF4D4BF
MPHGTIDLADDEQIDSLSELVMTWGRGWAVSRGTPAPVEVPGGFRVEVGSPGHRVRHVLHTYDADSLGRLARELTAPGHWIKAVGDPAEFRSALPDGWTAAWVGHLMTVGFRAEPVEPPAPYTIEVQTGHDGDLVVATVRDGTGATAASGGGR